MISQTSIIERSPNQVSCVLDGEVVLMCTQTGKYFKLDHIGARIWQLLENPSQLSNIFETILDEYDVAPEQGKNDIAAFLTQLQVKKFIRLNE